MNLILAFIYPPLCLHCRQTLQQQSHYLCTDCLSELKLLDPKYYCPFCFTQLESLHTKICDKCRRNKHPIHRKAAAFEGEGPAASLLSGLVDKKQPYLAKGASAFLVMQWANLNWDKPDLIIPVPRPLRQKIRRGFDPGELLAAEVGRLLQVPVQKALAFDDDERPPYKLKTQLEDKALLLIADKTGPLSMAAEVLMGAYPKSVHGLAFCTEIYD